MTEAELADVCIERLCNWAIVLSDEHAAPAVLLGLGVDDHKGEMTIVKPSAMTDAEALALLRAAQRLLEARIKADEKPTP